MVNKDLSPADWDILVHARELIEDAQNQHRLFGDAADSELQAAAAQAAELIKGVILRRAPWWKRRWKRLQLSS